jgi:DNA polymerase-3 subunit alpha
MQQKKVEIPFVGLHAHSGVGSPFDGLGEPKKHMNFAYENGMNAMALTDHGNMNALSYQILHAQRMIKDGLDFKPIFGVEAYFLPSVEDWYQEYLQIQEDNKNKKKSKQIATKADSTFVEDETESKKAVKNFLRKRNHLILLAQNQEGLNNIFKMVSKSFSGHNYYKYPRLDYQTLADNCEGVIAASACLGGVYAGNMWENKDKGAEAVLDAMRETSERMLTIFGDRWYGELQWNAIPEQHELNQYIIQVCKEYDIPLISTADSHYPTRDSWKDRELYKRLGWLNKTGKGEFKLPQSLEEMDYELYPKNGDEMFAAYKNYADKCGFKYDDKLVLDSITRTECIAKYRIDTFMPDNTVRLPEFIVPEGVDADTQLITLAAEGLHDSGLGGDKEYRARLAHELEVINKRGFSKYFLTMKAITDKGQEKYLMSPGRGSAAGSLVSYVLGITQVNPIKYGLLFSRFLREDATDYPDIDVDFSDAAAFKEELVEEWGENSVVPISNFSTLQLRSLIKDIGKFYSIPFTEVNAVTSKMVKEATPIAKAAHGIKAGVYVPTFEEVKSNSVTLKEFLQKYPDVATHVDAIFGSVRAISRHAGGVVVGENLNERMPLIKSGGTVQTPWSEGQNVRHLEPLGFIKFDILGISTLKMIERCVELILQRHENHENVEFKDIKAWYDSQLHPDVIDFEDQEVYKNVFDDGNFAGVFQFTQGGMQKFCGNAKPKNLIDISAITSIYRPGPLGANVDKMYVKAKNNNVVSYADLSGQALECYKKHTKETFGYMIFQEQIALLAHELGHNITLDDGNMLRKILVKIDVKKGIEGLDKDKKAKLAKYHKQFTKGCVEKGMTEKQADALFEKFKLFSKYGFNKSHAVAYSMLSYQCAWLLNYYPTEWMVSFLDKEPEKRKEQAINIARKAGFEIKGVDINKSGYNWDIDPDDEKVLIQPLNSIKGLGDAAITQIMNNRPFNTIEQLLFNDDIVYSKLNKKALHALTCSGALGCLVDERFTGLKHFWSACVVDLPSPRTRKRFKKNLEMYAPEGDFTKHEKIEFLASLTGLFPYNMIIDDDMADALEQRGIPALGNWDDQLGMAWFIPREVIEKRTKNGKKYWIVNVLDNTSESTTIRCWGVHSKDRIHINRLYVGKLDRNDNWGFSVRSISRQLTLIA